jgi:hypothetical protein
MLANVSISLALSIWTACIAAGTTPAPPAILHGTQAQLKQQPPPPPLPQQQQQQPPSRQVSKMDDLLGLNDDAEGVSGLAQNVSLSVLFNEPALLH